MKELLLMLRFFTTIPVGEIEFSERLYRRGIFFVPLIGLIMSLFLMACQWLFRGTILQGYSLLFLYVLLSGGLHLDGFADSVDGLFSRKDREGTLAVMRDSRIGSFGVLGLFFLLSGLLLSLSKEMPGALFFPFVGRSMAILSCHRHHYAREEGMGKIFVEGASLGILLVYLPIPILAAFFLKDWRILLALLFSLTGTLLSEGWFHRRVGGMSGDTVGFVIEASQLLYVIALTVLGAL